MLWATITEILSESALNEQHCFSYITSPEEEQDPMLADSVSQ